MLKQQQRELPPTLENPGFSQNIRSYRHAGTLAPLTGGDRAAFPAAVFSPAVLTSGTLCHVLPNVDSV